MSKEWLWWLGEFGLVAVVAVVAGFVTRDVPISILYGLFVGTVFFVLREHRRVVAQQERQVYMMEDKALNLPITLSHLENVDPYLKHVIESERNEFLRLAREVIDGEITIKTRTTGQLIIDYWKLSRPGDKIIATNSGAGWGTPAWEMYRQLNFEMAERGADFTRIFVEPTMATPEDKKHLKQEMDRQKEHLKVRFIKEAKLPPRAMLNSVLIGDRYYGYIIVSKPVGSGLRQVPDEFKVFTRRDEVEKAQELMETLIKLSEEYK
ncbi:MAG: hypothetical protein E3J94_04870 [Desulfobacteraceae bacterium]|nr:MAG: hypothetical protein E3J94_04870 [Desulfobacteraceae bacterium]